MSLKDKADLEKMAFIPVGGAVGAGLTGLAGGMSYAEGAGKTRQMLNRMKMRGGVMPSVNKMPPPQQPKVAAGKSLRSILNAPMKKEAAGGDVAKMVALNAAVALAGGMGVALTGELIRAGMGGVSSVTQKMSRKRLFNRIMQMHPEFKKDKETKDRAERYFRLIMAYAPSLARDDTAIADFMRRQLMYPTSSVEFLKQLADLEATIRGKVDANSVAARVSQRSSDQVSNYLGKALSDNYAGSGKGGK